jgi:molecular chaperone DnaK
VPKIEVSFDIDANGILNVTARDTATGKSQSVRISGSTRLAKDVKERMVQEAEQYAEADKKRREDAETLNEADGLCYQAEKMLADFVGKLTTELKDKLERARHETKEACAKHDAALAKEKADALRAALKEAGTVVYAQNQSPGSGPYQEVRYETEPGAAQAGEPQPGRGQHGRVVDADYH